MVELHWCQQCKKLFECYEDCAHEYRSAHQTKRNWPGLAPCPDCGTRPEPLKVF